MLYFILISALVATVITIGVIGAVFDARNRAAWQRTLRDDEGKHG